MSLKQQQTVIFLPVVILSMFGTSVNESLSVIPPMNSFQRYSVVGPTLDQQYSVHDALNVKSFSTLT